MRWILARIQTAILLGLCLVMSSCLKEEFIKVCYDDQQSGCLSLDNANSNSALKTVNLSSSANTSAESTGGIPVSIEISEAHSLDVTVPFYITGTATYQADKDFIISGANVSYDNNSGQGVLTIPAGYSSQSISINIVDDTLGEESETVILQLGVPTNSTLGSNNLYVLTITDNDSDPEVEFDATTSTVNEEDGSATINISLSKEAGKDITIPLLISGTSTVATDHSLSANSMTILKGQTSGSLSFSLLTDTVQEVDETLIVTMGAPTNASLGSNSVHTMTIVDNDDPPYIVWENAFKVLNENAGATSSIVKIDSVSQIDVTFDYTVTGDSTASDHDLVSGSGTITAGNLQTTLNFNILDDAISEADETIVISLSNVVGAQLSPAFTQNIIIKDDETKPEINFREASQVVSEINLGSTSKVYLELSKVSGSDITINFSIDTVLSNATNPAHHNLSDGAVTITAGNKFGEIDIDFLADAANGANKVLIIDIDSVNFNAADIGAINKHTVNLLDPKFKSIPTEQATYTEIASNRVNNIFETGSKLIASTQAGISISSDEGVTWKSYASGSGLKDLYVHDADYDTSRNKAYFGTKGGVATLNFPYQGLSFYTSANGLVSDNVTHVVGRGNNIAAGTSIGLSISSDGGSTWTTYNSGNSSLPANSIQCLYYDDANNLLYVCTNLGLVRTSNWGTSFTDLLDSANHLSSDNVVDFTIEGANAYILTDSGLHFGDITTPASLTSRDAEILINGANRRKISVNSSNIIAVMGTNEVSISTDSTGAVFNKYTTVSALTMSDLTGVLYSNGGNYFVSSRSNGLYKTTDSFTTMSLVSSSSTLVSNEVNAIDEDSSGHLYIATNHGISYTADTNFDNFSTNTNVADGIVNDVMLRDDDVVYVGTNFGWSSSTVAGIAAAFVLNTTGLPSNTVNSIYARSNGSGELVVGTDLGAFHSSDNGASGSTVFAAKDIRDIAFDAFQGHYYVASEDDVYSEDINFAGFATDLNPAGANTNVVRRLDDGSTLGAYYIGTSNGLFASVNNYAGYGGFTDIKSGINVTALDVYDNSGSHLIVAGNSSSGLSIAPTVGVPFTDYTVDNGLPSNSITAVKILSSGYAVIGTASGLAISRDDLTAP